MDDETIYITMFKTFSIQYHNQTLTSKTIKSDRLIKLFAYLLSQPENNYSLPSTKIIDVLWSEEDIDNPLGALKNLVYRLRTLLKKTFGIQDLIITGKGSYAINTDYKIVSDVALFDQYIRAIDADKTNLDNYALLVEQYQGRYLVELEGDHHVISRSTYFHSQYVTKVIEYAKLLEKNKDFIKMEDVMRQAIRIDRLEESFYECLIRALFFQEKYTQANECYLTTVNLLYQELGIRPSQSLLELHDMIKKEKHDEGTDITELQQELEQSQVTGAYFCQYGTFKDLYTLQSRMIGRLGVCSHYCLISLKNKNETEEIEKENLDKYMMKIHNQLYECLRIGDVYSRLSVNQYVVLLPACNYENAYRVMDRVLRKIRYTMNHSSLYIDVKIEEVAPLE